MGKNRSERRRREKERSKKGALVISGRIIGGRVCVLELQITSPDESKSADAQAIIDTGATHSAVSPTIANALSLPVVDQKLMHTAAGEQVVPIVIAKLKMGTFFRAMPVSVAPLSGGDQMLFGMDALAGGVLTVDTVRGDWEWNLQAVDVVSRPRKKKP